MKSTTILTIAAIGAIALIASSIFKKNGGDTPPTVSYGSLATTGGASYAALAKDVNDLRQEGKTTAQAFNETYAKLTKPTYTQRQASGYTDTPGGFTTTKGSSIGYKFDTGKTTSSGKALIGYASGKVRSITNVPKEQSMAYKLGYIK